MVILFIILFLLSLDFKKKNLFDLKGGVIYDF